MQPFFTMRKFLPFKFVFLSLFLFNNAKAQQEQAVHIAIIPFTSAAGLGTPDEAQAVDLVEKEVTGAFGNKDRFYILDRAKPKKLNTSWIARKINPRFILQ